MTTETAPSERAGTRPAPDPAPGLDREGTGGAEPRVVDVLVVGGGSAAETAGPRAAAAGLSVAVVEGSLVGGECPFWACVPSKAMLLAARGHRRSGSTDHDGAWAWALQRREEATADLDDGGKADGLREAGVELVRGWGEVERDAAGGGLVRVRRGGTSPEEPGDVVDVLRWRTLVLATGSSPSAPPVDGLADVATWTSDAALSSDHRPGSLLVLGGGAVGCELAQVYASFGVRTTLVETAPRVLASENPSVGEAVVRSLTATGVEVRTGVTARRARTGGDGVVLELDDGSEVTGERVLLASGRKPRLQCVEGLVLDTTDAGALAVDARYRVLADGEPLDDVYAVGDVNGLAPYTHGANYQARVVADALVGRPRDGDETGMPRAVYVDPPVLATGLTADGAREAGHDVVVASQPTHDTGRAHVERYDGPGTVELVVDARTGVLLGASVVGPEADSWGGELVLAVRGRLDVELLAEVVHPFPAWGELLLPAAEDARDQVRARRGEARPGAGAGQPAHTA
ncbi:NAD(P)/FAD-dependent oxidoreductase [uncultured Pseudokineococcus sp.]|uniref:dihydrolipoyl dehydrogenase family protein n=1 Tax=uncultured Pseudokineococcus sp. TaxID=1642928 RepID=UPI0026300F4A|nr:NAD(P)/FAD-dependent oxidoreductase [uncultured Pseudokineococcus sp.]